jgi:hypothetical protein
MIPRLAIPRLAIPRLAAALLLAGTLAACNINPQASASGRDTPVPGAVPPDASSDSARPTRTETPVRNSDNRPIESRSGLNSDPPGRTATTTMH